MNFDEKATMGEQAGFSLLEAMISVALVAIAMVGAFSVSKVMLQSKQLVDQKTDFQLASQTLNNNIAIGLQTLSLTDVIAIPAKKVEQDMRFTYCFALGEPLPNLLKSELCRMRFFRRSSSANVAPNYRVQLTNAINTAEDATGTNRYLRITVSFFNIQTGGLEFERVFLHVK